MEQLPTNILVKIFENLPSQELIALSCTCKKFLEITKDFLGIKFPPIRIDFQNLYYNKQNKFTYRDGKDFNVLIETTRLHQNFVLVNFNKEHTDRLNGKWLKLFKTQINARTIRIKSDCMNLQEFIELIKLTQRLILLEVDGYRLVDDNVSSTSYALLPSLKHLKLHSFLDMTPKFFEIFKECTLLKTISLNGLMAIKESKLITDLICKQKALEQLELIGLDTQCHLFDNFDAIVPYKLKKLNIEYNGYSINLDKFFIFLREQNLLKEIKLAFDLRNSLKYTHDLKLCHEIIAFCMSLQSLSALYILVNKFSSKEIKQEFPLNNNIKTLIYENETRNENTILIELLKSLPNLRNLELACEYDDVLAELAQVKKLKRLKLTDYHQGLLKKIKCSESLKSITVKYCYTQNCGPDWYEFLTAHPNISEIRIENSIDFVDDAIIELIAGTCKDKLQTFRISESAARNVSENAIKSFQRHCPNLKFLQLTDMAYKRAQNYKHQSFHMMLANIKCIVLFYLVCIILFIVLIVLMILEKI